MVRFYSKIKFLIYVFSFFFFSFYNIWNLSDYSTRHYIYVEKFLVWLNDLSGLEYKWINAI